MPDLADPLELPCGAVLPNRLAKAAMSEQLGRGGRPGRGLCRLYARWDRGGAGMLLTGNVMVDPTHLESRRNVILGPDADLAPMRAWAASAPNTPLWVQLNHPGRQCPRHIHPHPLAPSAGDKVALLGRVGAFGAPRAMTPEDIAGVIAAFARAAGQVRAAGFDGVQLHGAHGYLVSQFLSPRTNHRKDGWGGDLHGRSRFLRETLAAMREAVGDDFPLAVKLNSADFQRGGFTEDECMDVLVMLEGLGVDLIEISGGSYEAPRMFDLGTSTGRREAYFLDFARRARARVRVPLMVTGGFRSREVMEQAVHSGAVDLVGIGRPLAAHPDGPRQLLEGERDRLDSGFAIPVLHDAAQLSQAALSVAQMALMARGMEPEGRRGALATVTYGLANAVRDQLRRG